jgi:HEAT repeat protein
MSQDYNEAVQHPPANFSDPELSLCTVVTNPHGIPLPCSGNFADVYEMRGPGERRWAVKCFTRYVAGLGQRYEAISRHLQKTQLPFAVPFKYLDQGIRVRDQWYPVLKMQWVEGLLLNEFVRRYADRPDRLSALLRLWSRLAETLRAARIAHGDLQHGNLLLVPSAANNAVSAKLIDYDGIYVPALAGCPSGELGHPNYQHPQRQGPESYGLELDRFSLLLVATALVCLQTGGRRLWDKYDSGDNLLFRASDLQTPTRSGLFAELLKLPNPLARKLVGLLIDALRGRLEEVPLLQEVLPEQVTAGEAPRPPAPPAQRAKPATPEWVADVGEEGVPTPQSPLRSTRSAPSRNRHNRAARVWALSSIALLGLGAVVALAFLFGRSSPTEPRRVAGAPTRPLPTAMPPTTATPATDPIPITTAKPPPRTEPPAPGTNLPPPPTRSPPPPPPTTPTPPPPATTTPPPPPKTEKPPATKAVVPLTAETSVAVLRRALNEEELARQETAADLLAKRGAAAAEAVPDLTHLLKESRGVVARRNAAIALGAIGAASRPAVPALAAALRAGVPVEVRQGAAEALGRLGYPCNEEAVPALVAALEKDDDLLVRSFCVFAVQAIPDLNRLRLRKILTAVIEETSPTTILVRWNAARLLAYRLRDDAPDRAIDLLLDLLQNKTVKVFLGSEAAAGGDARFMAADALGQLGKKGKNRRDVVDALKAAVADPDPQLSKSASAALKALGLP